MCYAFKLWREIWFHMLLEGMAVRWNSTLMDQIKNNGDIDFIGMLWAQNEALSPVPNPE